VDETSFPPDQHCTHDADQVEIAKDRKENAPRHPHAQKKNATKEWNHEIQANWYCQQHQKKEEDSSSTFHFW
jgi:hypothetical protein